MGVVAHHPARLTVRSYPHQHERKFSGAHVCIVTFKHLPQLLKSHIRSFGTLGQLLRFPVIHFCRSNKNLCPPNYSIVRVVGGGSPILLLLLESSYFCDLGAHAKI